MSTIPGTASGTEVDKATLLETLRRGEEAFLHSVAGVSETTSRLRPAENRWSVLECAEHVAVAEEVMLGFSVVVPIAACVLMLPINLGHEAVFLRWLKP
jgi:hypothetical protein